MKTITTFSSPMRVSPIFDRLNRIDNGAKSMKVYNSNEQIQLANILTWRQKTCLPIVKVVDFKTQNNELKYPKTFIIELETIKRTLKDLQQIQLPHSIYLLQQFSLGVHALCKKYGKFDHQKLFFGFNEKEQCRVWLSNDLLECFPKQIRLPADQVIITQIFKAIQGVCSEQSKMKLKEILHEIVVHPQLRFGKFHEMLNQFVHRNYIKLPTNMKFDMSNSLLTSTSFINKSLTPSKINFRYQSPMPKDLTSKTIPLTTCSFVATSTSITSSQTIKSQSHKKNTNSPTVHFSYDRSGQSSLGNSILGSPTCSSRSSLIQHSQNAINITKMSNLYQPTNSIVFNSQIPKSGSQIAKDYYFGGPHYQGQIKCDGIYKTSSSLTFPHNVTRSFNCVEKRNEKFNEQKESVSTLQSQNNNSQQYKDTINPHAKPDSQSNNGKYNFGGLIPLHHESSNKNQILISESPKKITELFDSRKNLTSLQNNSSPVIRSIIISQSGVQQSNLNLYQKVWDWGNKMNNLFMNDHQDLKQSYYCGQEKIAEPLPIKLQLLGKFGRNIASSNIIHEQN